MSEKHTPFTVKPSKATTYPKKYRLCSFDIDGMNHENWICDFVECQKPLAEYIVMACNEHEQLKKDRAELIGRIKEQNKLMANIGSLRATVKMNQELLKKVGEEFTNEV